MDYYMNDAGLGVPCIREYETAVQKDLAKGTVMTLTGGKAAVAAASSAVLGLLAEDYRTVKDPLNPRSGSGRVRVIVSPGTICRQKHLSVTVAEAGSAVSLKLAGLTAPSEANAFAGGYIRLAYKPENSDNTDFVGKVRKITASSSTTLTVDSGGTPCVGDVYEILPPAGFTALTLNADATAYTTAASKSTTAKVVSALPESDCLEIGFVNTFFH